MHFLIPMSHNVSVSTGSSQSQETSSSGYRTQEELPKKSRSPSSSSGRKPGDTSDMDREKLKEELLRQFEAGQLKPSVGVLSGSHHHGPTILSGNSNLPRQIPTIEEYRQTSAVTGVVQFRKPVAVSATLPTSSLNFPDLSRPPPGYIYSSQQALVPSIQLNQAHSINSAANYEVEISCLVTVNQVVNVECFRRR